MTVNHLVWCGVPGGPETCDLTRGKEQMIKSQLLDRSRLTRSLALGRACKGVGVSLGVCWPFLGEFTSKVLSPPYTPDQFVEVHHRVS